MRRSARSNVKVAHASRPPLDGRSRELKMESSCRGAESRRSFRFCAVRLAMPLARLSGRLDTKTLKLFRIDSSCALAVRMWCSRFMMQKTSPRRDYSAKDVLGRCYFCEPNCDSARRRLSAAPFSSGSRRSAVSNSGMLSRALPEASRAKPRLL